MYKRRIEVAFKEVWQMKAESRMEAMNNWRSEMLQERVARLHEAGTVYNASLNQIQAIHMEKDLQVIRRKRIIGCTTTAAAKYVQALQSISRGVLVVEEAGEILESHVLTALGPETKQLILIGDHKQLRPKVHHDLSVEKGDGYDLNRSLFERLVLGNYPHQVLYQQHRMRPELSALVRQLTYPDLVDAPNTRGRPDLRGFRDNLIFVNHSEPEIELQDVPDWKDTTSSSSKKNMFEAKMTLKCVRYLGQQGYRTDNIVVLTPYLGQFKHFHSLSCLPNWGNGRDVKTLSKAIVASAFESAESASTALTVSHKDVVAALQKTLITQLARCETKAGRESLLSNGTMASIFNLPTASLSPQPTISSTSSAAKLAEPAPALADGNPRQEQQVDVAPREQPRDTGVSDETWTQLQADIRANELAQKKSQDAIVDLEQQLETVATEQEARAQETIPDDDDDEENERKRRHEELRIRALKARHAKQEAEEKLRKAGEEADRKRKEEAQAQKKLRDMGVCPVGFRWIKQRTGYRCAGGSHFVSNSELGT